MSYLNIENRQGVRYRVREGWYYPPHLPQGLTEHFVDLPLLQSFDDAVLEQVCQKFLGFAQALPDPTNPHYRPQFESTFQFDPYAGAPAFFSDPGKKIYLALAQQRLIIEENPPGEDELAEQQSQLLQKIRMALRQIIAQERAEAAQHAQRLARESRTSRALIYTGAFFNGLWNAGVDLAKWAKEVSDVVNPTQRLLRSMHASHRALQRSRENGENILTAYLDEHLKGEKRELVQALGFDPTAITQEQFDQAMEIADLVWESPALRADLIRFAKDYVQAQHAIELTNLSGSAAFEILFTIVLAAVTAGAGLAASAASQARHLAKFRKVGDLLMEFAEHIKKVRQRLRRNSARGNDGPSRSLDDLPVDEVSVNKYSIDEPTRSVKIEKPANTPNEEVSPQRPTWRQSEIDVGASLEKQGFKSQVSFKDGSEVPYGTKGSTRPEYYREGASIEVKNYNVETAQGRSNLVRNVSQQAINRAKNLPANTTQQIHIDIRGQNISREQLKNVIKRIVEKSNGSLRTEDINILR